MACARDLDLKLFLRKNFVAADKLYTASKQALAFWPPEKTLFLAGSETGLHKMLHRNLKTSSGCIGIS